MAQNPFEIRQLKENPFQEILKLNRQRKAEEEKRKALDEKARLAQMRRDQQTVLNKKIVPLKEEDVKTGGLFGFGGKKETRYTVGGERVSPEEFNLQKTRNKIIQEANQRLQGQPQQRSQPVPKSQPTTQAGMGIADRLRTSLSSFMSGNRGGQVVGQPNTPIKVDESPLKLQKDIENAEKLATGKLPMPDNRLKNQIAEKKIGKYKVAEEARKKKERKDSIRKAIARNVSKVEVEGANLREATKKKVADNKSRFREVLSREKKNIDALIAQTPSLREMIEAYGQGVKRRAGQFVKYGVPQARVVRREPVKRNFRKYGSGDSPE